MAAHSWQTWRELAEARHLSPPRGPPYEVCLDGVYAQCSDGSLEFHDTGTPSQADVEKVAARLHGAIRRMLLRRGLITPEGELVPRDSQVDSSLEQLCVAAARDARELRHAR